MAKKTVSKKKGRGGARKGAGRPAVMADAKYLGMYIPATILDRVNKWRPAGTNQAEAIRLLLDKALTAEGG